MPRGKTGTKQPVKSTVRQPKPKVATKTAPKPLKKASTTSKNKQQKSIVPPGLQASATYHSTLLAPRTAVSNSISRTPQPGISITVQIPALRRPKKTVGQGGDNQAKLLRRPAVVAAVLLFVVAAGVIGFHGLHKNVRIAAGNEAAAASRTQPDFQPLVPSAAQATATDYNGQKNLVSYDTNFGNARITVSQQPLPNNFKTDINALKRAADSIDATQKFDTDHGPVYVANSTTDESQLGIYADKDVLVFIHTDKKLDASSWTSFIGLLQSKSWQQINQG